MVKLFLRGRATRKDGGTYLETGIMWSTTELRQMRCEFSELIAEIIREDIFGDSTNDCVSSWIDRYETESRDGYITCSNGKQETWCYGYINNSTCLELIEGELRVFQTPDKYAEAMCI